MTQASISLHATINPNGCTTEYQFIYGKRSAHGHRTPIVHVGSGTSPIIAAGVILGLDPNTSYHVRVIAYSATGKTLSPDLKVKTKLAGVVRIAPGPAYLDRPFVASIKLSCVHGRHGCNGHVKIYRAHQIIGQHRFFLRRGRTAVIAVGLDSLGRTLFRAHQTLRVAVVARLKHYETTRPETLIRAFAVPGG